MTERNYYTTKQNYVTWTAVGWSCWVIKTELSCGASGESTCEDEVKLAEGLQNKIQAAHVCTMYINLFLIVSQKWLLHSSLELLWITCSLNMSLLNTLTRFLQHCHIRVLSRNFIWIYMYYVHHRRISPTFTSLVNRNFVNTCTIVHF